MKRSRWINFLDSMAGFVTDASLSIGSVYVISNFLQSSSKAQASENWVTKIFSESKFKFVRWISMFFVSLSFVAFAVKAALRAWESYSILTSSVEVNIKH